jgi:hypothetical protein
VRKRDRKREEVSKRKKERCITSSVIQILNEILYLILSRAGADLRADLMMLRC